MSSQSQIWGAPFWLASSLTVALAAASFSATAGSLPAAADKLQPAVSAEVRVLTDTPMRDGRLVFSSKESLAERMQALNTLNEKQLADEFAGYYGSGFEPLVPHFNESDWGLMQDYAERRVARDQQASHLARVGAENIDASDTLISDDVFASLLNDRREIQVGEHVYKYTEDGIYFVAPENIRHLDELLAANRTAAASETSPPPAIEICDEAIQTIGGQRTANLPASVGFINRCEIIGGGGTPPPPPPPPSPPTAEDYLNSIGYCQGSGATFPFFGDAKICISTYSDSRYRVKTRYWNENYYVYRSIGVKVKNQRRRLGIWWASDASELRLGLNQVYFEYTVPVPDYSSIAALRFVHNGMTYNANGQPISPATGANTPQFPFNTNNFDTVHIYVKLLGYPITTTITPESVNSLLWSQLWNTARSIAQSNGQSNLQSAVLTGITPNKVVVSYMDKSFIDYNDNIISKVFDFQIGLGITLGFGDNGNIGIVGASLPDFYSYDNVRVDVSGIARRGTQWRGSKLKYEDSN